jgi:hypothetical protein
MADHMISMYMTDEFDSSLLVTHTNSQREEDTGSHARVHRGCSWKQNVIYEQPEVVGDSLCSFKRVEVASDSYWRL